MGSQWVTGFALALQGRRKMKVKSDIGQSISCLVDFRDLMRKYGGENRLLDCNGWNWGLVSGWVSVHFTSVIEEK